MALQNEKTIVIFCATGNQKIRPSGKIKETYCSKKPLDISQLSTSCLLCWMLFSAVTVNLNKIGFNFTTINSFY